MVRAARQAGVEGCLSVVCVNANLLAAKQARSIVAAMPPGFTVKEALGIHPHDAKDATPPVREYIRQCAEDPTTVAVGEAGLDYHYNHSPKHQQIEVFQWHVALAQKVHKPLIVHTRNAAADTLSVLQQAYRAGVGGVIHCFSEDVPFARRALDLGFYVSFSGILTFPKSHSIQAAARFAPPNRILVETDAPYLAPIPHRGKRNEPAHVRHTARHLARLKHWDFAHLDQVQRNNVRELFGF